MGDFTDYIKGRIEEGCNRVPMVLKEEENIRIARINYVYENQDIIRKLDARGNLVVSGTIEVDKGCCTKETIDPINKINLSIEENFIHDKNRADKDKRFSYTSPCAAYITFETQEGYERAALYWDIK